MKKEAKKYIKDTFGSYKVVDIKEAANIPFNLIQIYDTKKYAYPNGFKGTNFFKIKFFNTGERIACYPDCEFDQVNCDTMIGPKAVNGMSVFPDGSVMLVLNEYISLSEMVGTSFYLRSFVPIFVKGNNKLKEKIFAAYCKQKNMDSCPEVFVNEWGAIKIKGTDQEYLIFTGKEADEECRIRIIEDLGLFDSEFIAKHTKARDKKSFCEALEKMKLQLSNEELCEVIETMILKMDNFVQDSIETHGRGHFLAPFDEVETKVMVDNCPYYVYRVN